MDKFSVFIFSCVGRNRCRSDSGNHRTFVEAPAAPQNLELAGFHEFDCAREIPNLNARLGKAV